MDNRDWMTQMISNPSPSVIEILYQRPAEFLIFDNERIVWTFFGIRHNKDKFALVDVEIMKVRTLSDYKDVDQWGQSH